MARVFLAPFTEFGELDFPLYFADIFAGPIIVSLAYSALQSNKIWLGHISKTRN